MLLARPIALAVSAALALGGCANTGANYRPMVDTKDVDMTRFESDLSDCSAYAARTAGAAEMAAVGAVVGALIGAVLATTGGAKRDRGEIARVGAVSGALGAAADGERDQRTIIRNCLSGRGYKVLQ